LEFVEDVLEFRPKLSRRILKTIAALQGTEDNLASEEEPGKIIHEYRNIVVDGRPIKGVQLRIFRDLAAKWGGTQTELAYYGSIDATPHFLRTLARYCRHHGNDILSDKVIRRDGKIITMLEIAGQAAEWLISKLAVSRSGMLEYLRVNPHGIENQVWKDSSEFYVHEDGQMANHTKPIASIEVQALAYDALISAAQFFPKKKEIYLNAANRLRDLAIKLLWLPERNYFALGADFDNDDNLRVIRTKSANAATLLDSGFFDGLPGNIKEDFVRAIVTTILSEDFLTNAGIRSRALSAADLVDHWDYHGSFVSWPKETYDICKGLRRQGLLKLARQLENRLLNITLKTQEYPEFIYVDEWGRVLGGAPTRHQHGGVITINGRNTPERVQAWTLSAVMAIQHRRSIEKVEKPASERANLEAAVLENIPYHDRYLNPLKLIDKYPSHKYRLASR
jgi:glycogen debranching enzyme